MTAWLARARWWQVGLLAAPLLGTVFGLMARFARDESWAYAIAFGAVTGLLCGGIVGALTSSRAREDADGMPPRTYARVDRAARRGPVPEDPEERAAAHRLLMQRLARIRESRTRAGAGQAVMAVVGAALALGSTSWWWLAVAVAVALLATTPLVVRHLERRAGLLAESPQ